MSVSGQGGHLGLGAGSTNCSATSPTTQFQCGLGKLLLGALDAPPIKLHQYNLPNVGGKEQSGGWKWSTVR